MKKISIITPSYNCECFIEKAIKSVMEQDYPNFEHIIIDGGSTDGTLEIIKKYPHIKWISEKDNGQSDALNKGFRMATGDIIGWLNADEYYVADAFKTVNEVFLNNNIDALYGKINFVDKNLNFIDEKRSHSFDKDIIVFYCFIPTAAFFFSKNLLDKNAFIDASFELSMDKELFSRLGKENRNLLFVPKHFSDFIVHDNNKTAPSRSAHRTAVRESIEIMNRYYHDFSHFPYQLQVIIHRLLLYKTIIKRRIRLYKEKQI